MVFRSARVEGGAQGLAPQAGKAGLGKARTKLLP